MRSLAFAAALIAALILPAQAAGPITAASVPQSHVNSTGGLAKLIANKGVTLQWNWNAGPGKLAVEARDGWLHLKAEQRDSGGGSLEIDGVVTQLDDRIFTFRGRIALYDAEAKVDCVRNGDYTFRITGARKFWRLKEQIAGCPGRADLTDYVDIRF